MQRKGLSASDDEKQRIYTTAEMGVTLIASGYEESYARGMIQSASRGITFGHKDMYTKPLLCPRRRRYGRVLSTRRILSLFLCTHYGCQINMVTKEIVCDLTVSHSLSLSFSLGEGGSGEGPDVPTLVLFLKPRAVISAHY